MAQQFRLVTRSDFDGLVCAVLFKHMGMIDDIKFVHPKDMQDGIIDISNRDITTNLPFENWTEVCGSERLTGAMLDRLTHKVHIIEANGASYRLEQSRKRLARQKKRAGQD